MPIRRNDANGVPDRGTNAGGVTGIIVTVTSALGIAPIVEDQYLAVYFDAHRLVDLGTNKRTRTKGIAIEIIKVSMTFRKAIIVKL
jgi:hypothetical protein